jgi:hypothetical protein
MIRPDHHWEDARVLATLETMTDSIMNLRQMKMSGLEPNQVAYLRRQRERIDVCLDWLENQSDRTLEALEGLDDTDRAEQTGDDVVAATEIEVHHVGTGIVARGVLQPRSE